MTPLALLRRLERKLDDTSRLILVILAGLILSYGFAAGAILSRSLSLLGVIILEGAIFARTADLNGQRQVLQLAKKAAPSIPKDLVQFVSYLGINWPASDDEIKAAARRKMKEIHPDSGGYTGADLDLVKQVRDYLIAQPRQNMANLTRAQFEMAWRQHAGWLGQFWGALFPSDALFVIQEFTGKTLWPHPLDQVAKAMNHTVSRLRLLA